DHPVPEGLTANFVGRQSVHWRFRVRQHAVKHRNTSVREHGVSALGHRRGALVVELEDLDQIGGNRLQVLLEAEVALRVTPGWFAEQLILPLWELRDHVPAVAELLDDPPRSVR